jgi:hypothetical protein
MITNMVGPFRWNHEPTEYAKIPIPTANKRAIRGLPEKPRGFGSLVSNMLFLPWSAVSSEKFLSVAHWKSQSISTLAVKSWFGIAGCLAVGEDVR